MRTARLCSQEAPTKQRDLVTEGTPGGVRMRIGAPGAKKHSSLRYYLETGEIHDLLFNCEKLSQFGSL